MRHCNAAMWLTLELGRPRLHAAWFASARFDVKRGLFLSDYSRSAPGHERERKRERERERREKGRGRKIESERARTREIRGGGEVGCIHVIVNNAISILYRRVQRHFDWRRHHGLSRADVSKTSPWCHLSLRRFEERCHYGRKVDIRLSETREFKLPWRRAGLLKSSR